MPEKFPINPESLLNKPKNNPEAKKYATFSVNFQRDINKKNGQLKYVNSDPTFQRKRVVLEADTKINPTDGVEYTVQVIKDTKPEDPTKGELVVRIVSKTKDREAQFHRASRLRDSVHFRILAQLVRRNPEIYEEMLQVLDRREEFKTNLAGPGEHHRDFAALFAALHLNNRSSVLLDQAIDRTAEAESEWLKEQIREGNNYVHELLIGTGVHSGVYRQERLMIIPEDPGLAIDRDHKIGGQFAQFGGDAFYMNSRNRPENKRLPHIPGTEGSLNSQGSKAVTQPSDVSGEIYPTNWDNAQSVRANQFMIGRNVVDFELKLVEPLPPGDGPESGILKVTAVDTMTGEEYVIRTDRLVLPSGIGTEISGLDETKGQTELILQASKQDIRSGELAKIYLSSQISARLADPTNPYPQRGIKRVVAWGKGDSFKVAIGGLLGHEGQMGKTVTQLDRVQEVVAIGQEFLTKEEWMRCERARYHTLGLEFPRAQVEEYYHRIKPLKGKGLYLEEGADGNPVLVAEVENENGFKEIQRFPMPEGTIGVSAAGYRDDSEKIFAPLAKKELSQSETGDAAVRRKILSTPGTVIEYKTGTPNRLFNRLTIVGSSLRAGTFRFTYELDRGVSGRDTLNFESSADVDYIFRDPIERVIFSEPVLLTEQIFAPGIQDPVAVKYKGHDVQRIGPAARLPLTENEKSQSPVFQQIPENSAAIFRYTDYVAAVAQLNARQDLKDGFIEAVGLSTLEQKKEKIVLPSPKKTGKAKGSFAASGFELDAERKSADKYLPMGSNAGDLLNFAIGEKAAAFVFPPDLDAITFHVSRTAGESDKVAFNITSTPKLPVAYNVLFESIFDDQLTQRMMRLFTDRRVTTNPSQQVDIKLPLIEEGDNKVVYVGKISYDIPLPVKKQPAKK